MIDLINKAESKNLIYEKWSSADCILSSVVIDSKLIKSDVYDHLDVETCGNHARGSIFLNHDFIKNLTSNVRLIKKINNKLYKKMLYFSCENGHDMLVGIVLI